MQTIMKLDVVKRTLDANKHLWEHNALSYEDGVSSLENAKMVEENTTWIAKEVREKRLERILTLYPNITKGTQRMILLHKPGISLDFLKVPEKKV